MEIPEPLLHCYDRTLRVENPGLSSAFVLTYRDQPWLVTAWHVAHDHDTGERKPFEVFDRHGLPHSDSELHMLDMTSTWADVAVFRLWPGYSDSSPDLLPYAEADLGPTQDAYFLGFPDLGEPLRYGIKYRSPATPFIKQAMVSGLAKHRTGTTKKVWILDAIAHHGFSGGPVIVRDGKTKEYRVLGVISGYVPSNVRILPWEVPTTPRQIGGAPPKPGNDFSETNSGLAVCFDVEHALADIDHYLASESP